MTVEEIDILVQASIEGAVKEFQKLVPEIRKQVKQIKEQMNNADFSSITGKVQQAVKIVKQKIANLKNSNKSNVIEIKATTENANKQISQLQKQIDSLQEKINARQLKLNVITPKLDEITTQTTKDVTPNGISPDNPAIQQAINNSLNSNKEYISLIAQEEKMTQEIAMYNKQLSEAKNKMSELRHETGQTGTSQNKLASFFSVFKSKLDQAKGSIGSLKNSFSQMPKITQNITNNIKGMGKSLKSGLGQVLKYAGALFSLRGIYSVLSSSAQSWLSSQNAGAQQLSANIDYMKNAMGSALAPVIQFVTNLVYQLMKAIQSVVYALFRVNIFANASAKSMGSVAGNTKKATKEAKQLAGIHDEINNVQENDNSNNGGAGSGSVAPSFDLSGVDSQLSPLAQKLYDLFKPLKESWDNYGTQLVEQIKITAGQVGGLIASVWGSFEKIITNGTVYSILENILAIIGNIAEAFANAWNYNGNGDAIVQSLANAFNNLLIAINNVVQSPGFQDWLNWCSDKFREISEKLSEIDWQPLINALVQIGTTVGSIALEILSGLVDIFKWLVEHPDVITVILGIVAALKGFSIINDVIQKVSALGEIFNTVFSGLSLPLLAIIAVVALVVYTIITHFDELKASLSDTFGKFMAVYDEYIAPFVENLVSSITTLWNEHLKPLIDNLSELIMTLWNDILKPLIDWFIGNILPVLVPIFESLWNTISQVVGFIADAISGVVTVFKGIIEFISGVFSGDWNKAWEGIKTFFNGIWEAIKGIISGVWEAIKGIIQTAINVVKGVITTVFNAIKTVISNIWNGITTTISNVINGIKNTISNVLNAISSIWNNIWNGLKTTVSNIFNAIWGAIKGVINSILGGIENMANGVIKGINWVIKALNKLSFDIPDWVPVFGGKKFGFNLSTLNEISMPRLAKGGVLYEETAFIGGEYQGASNNPEIVTPQNIMYDTMRRAIEDAQFFDNNNGQPIYLTVNVGNKKLGQILLDDLKDKVRHTGKDIETLVGG